MGAVDVSQNVMKKHTRKKVFYMPHIVNKPIYEKQDISHLNYDDNKFNFFFSFDLNSTVSRKNPKALIGAFKKAFNHKNKK